MCYLLPMIDNNKSEIAFKNVSMSNLSRCFTRILKLCFLENEQSMLFNVIDGQQKCGIAFNNVKK